MRRLTATLHFKFFCKITRIFIHREHLLKYIPLVYELILIKLDHKQKLSSTSCQRNDGDGKRIPVINVKTLFKKKSCGAHTFVNTKVSTVLYQFLMEMNVYSSYGRQRNYILVRFGQFQPNKSQRRGNVLNIQIITRFWKPFLEADGKQFS